MTDLKLSPHWLAHSLTDSTNYKEMLSHLKKIKNTIFDQRRFFRSDIPLLSKINRQHHFENKISWIHNQPAPCYTQDQLIRYETIDTNDTHETYETYETYDTYDMKHMKHMIHVIQYLHCVIHFPNWVCRQVKADCQGKGGKNLESKKIAMSCLLDVIKVISATQLCFEDAIKKVYSFPE